jgi:quinol monooxygenase YgiN
MPVTYVIRFDVRADSVDRFLSLLDDVLDAMREERNFHEAMLHRDPDTAHRFMLYETWEDHADVLETQMRRPYRQAYHDALPDLLAAPRDISVWQPMRADRRQERAR